MKIMSDQANTQTPVEIIATVGKRKGTVNLEAKREGKIFEAMTFRADHAEKRHRFAKKAGVTDEVVQEAIDKAIQAVVPNPSTAKPSAAPEPFKVLLRGMHQPQAHGQTFVNAYPLAALQAVLAVTNYPAAEPVIEWHGTDQLASLDFDFHDLDFDHRPDPRRLHSLATLIHPRPALWWVTHGRGLRLIYAALDGYLADELGACAALSLRSLEPTATVEILDHTRHPAYFRLGYPPAGPVTIGTPTAEIGVLARWLGNKCEDTQVQDWLAEQGLEMGGKYAHDRCPVDPTTPSHGEPVLVGEAGVKCFKCEASGITLGTRKPGFFSYAALISGGIPSRLSVAAHHHCHWEHAQHILAEDVGIMGELAKRCYSALLKALHGPDDPLANETLYRGTGLVRADGYWVTADLTRAHTKEGLEKRLAKLPAVLFLGFDEEGQEKLLVNTERLGILQGVDDLSAFGYPRVQPVRGMKIYGHWRSCPDPHVLRAVLLPEFLRSEAMRPYRPQYVSTRKRMNLAEAEAVVSDSFPGINQNYLKLLIAARGCAEGGVGQPPMIGVYGPSGSAKTLTVAVAAALIGDTWHNVPWTPFLEHFQQSMYKASMNAGLVTSDEIIKLASGKNGDVLFGLTWLLTFTPSSIIRLMYTGPASMRQMPAIIITDIAFPAELLADEQLGRRLVLVHLDRKVDWQKTAKDITRWRTLDLRYAAAANAIVSHVIDTFFADDTPMPFEDIAKELGFGLLNQGGDMGLDPDDDLLALFAACCSTEAMPVPSTTLKGKGWKLIKRESTDALSQRWIAVCDNMADGFITSRRVKERDWAQLLGVTEPVECDLKPNGKQALGIRFRIGNPRSPSLKVNEEITVPPPSPPDPLSTSAPSDPPPSSPPESPKSPAVAAPGAGDQACAAAKGCVNHYSEPVAADGNVVSTPIYFDLETRSACNLQKEGGRRYAQHPTTEILTVAAQIDNRMIAWTPLLDMPLPAGELWPDGINFPSMPVESFAGPDVPAPLAEAIAAGRPLCAHNCCSFDMHVWRAKNLPEPAQWLDSLPDARAAGLPGKLDQIGKYLFGVTKDKEGEALVKRVCRPDQTGRFQLFTREKAIKVLRYNIVDVLLLARLHTDVAGRAEPDVVALDRIINERGIAFDADLANALIRLDVQLTAMAKAEMEQLTGGAIKAGDLGRIKKIQVWLKSRGVSLPDLKRETVERYLMGAAEVDLVVRCVLQARLATGRVTTNKLETAMHCQDADGRLRDMLVYHKAHTGRWAGCKLQPHNLPRPHKELKDLAPLLSTVHDREQFLQALPAGVTFADGISALIRLALRGAPDYDLLIGDWAGIEARALAWCAGEQSSLEQFAAGADVYLDFGSIIFGRQITKADQLERNVGKEAVLGLGYQMSADKFATRCAARGIDLAAAGTTAKQVVETYRDRHPAIAGTRVTFGRRTWRKGGLWKDVEAAARDAILTGTPREAGRCLFLRDGSNLVIQLPSKRRLYYRNARIESNVPVRFRATGLPAKVEALIVYDCPGKKGMESVETYGGKLVENIVQAISRDLLVAAMLECERQGLPIVLHVHDETVCEVPKTATDEALRRQAIIMSTPPTWAAGLPLEVECIASERYTKIAPKGSPIIRARNGIILQGS